MEGYLGEIRLYPGYIIPAGWVPCKGQIVFVKDNQPLFQVLGNSFGGDFSDPNGFNFALPTMESPFPGMIYIICVAGTPVRYF